MEHYIKENTEKCGKLRIVLKNKRYFVESINPVTFRFSSFFDFLAFLYEKKHNRAAAKELKCLSVLILVFLLLFGKPWSGSFIYKTNKSIQTLVKIYMPQNVKS